ncbi:hypothetical protein SAMN05216483_6781 [Streptomyces sp. 2131.1]|uniref:hypothetical protein n=1 Tax=Streptomyces sp. 2131.1 TaxID=1855346 RepID=UPI0008953B2A|nr:hypothetical protein [Streptomyces sp. 2131.1]SEE84963.1 hypothetical protein SAMN05216483_6781 [Streptomyces sp. 2131.1]
MTAVDEQTGLAFYEFIDARLDEELRTKYPTTDSTPAMEEYRQKYCAAKKEHDDLVDALHRGDQEQAADLLWGLRNQASPWKAHADYPEPISDGTMPCPVSAPETGHPCVKRIPNGWAAAEGHGGGHFWQAPKATELQNAGAHVDYRTLLSGQPAAYHLPEDCTPDCWKWGD